MDDRWHLHQPSKLKYVGEKMNKIKIKCDDEK